jgi:hypothetical protein
MSFSLHTIRSKSNLPYTVVLNHFTLYIELSIETLFLKKKINLLSIRYILLVFFHITTHPNQMKSVSKFVDEYSIV